MKVSQEVWDKILAEVEGWNKQWKRAAVPVLVSMPHLDKPLATVTSGLAYIVDRDTAQPWAGIQVKDNRYNAYPLSAITVHECAEALLALPHAKGEDAEWRHPDCPECDQEMSSDGDTLYCENCPITWSSDGRFSERDCVENCGCSAEVIGSDSQPRCRGCEFQVLLGVFEPTSPYHCKACNDYVVGQPAGSTPDTRRLCPVCSVSRDATERAYHRATETIKSL